MDYKQFLRQLVKVRKTSTLDMMKTIKAYQDKKIHYREAHIQLQQIHGEYKLAREKLHQNFDPSLPYNILFSISEKDNAEVLQFYSDLLLYLQTMEANRQNLIALRLDIKDASKRSQNIAAKQEKAKCNYEDFEFDSEPEFIFNNIDAPVADVPYCDSFDAPAVFVQDEDNAFAMTQELESYYTLEELEKLDIDLSDSPFNYDIGSADNQQQEDESQKAR